MSPLFCPPCISSSVWSTQQVIASLTLRLWWLTGCIIHGVPPSSTCCRSCHSTRSLSVQTVMTFLHASKNISISFFYRPIVSFQSPVCRLLYRVRALWPLTPSFSIPDVQTQSSENIHINITASLVSTFPRYSGVFGWVRLTRSSSGLNFAAGFGFWFVYMSTDLGWESTPVTQATSRYGSQSDQWGHSPQTSFAHIKADNHTHTRSLNNSQHVLYPDKLGFIRTLSL